MTGSFSCDKHNYQGGDPCPQCFDEQYNSNVAPPDDRRDPFTGILGVLSMCCRKRIIKASFMDKSWPVCSGCNRPIGNRGPNKVEEYDSLENNPLINEDKTERLVEEIPRGYETVADGEGNPRGLDLAKDGRTEDGFYWEFDDIAEAAREIIQALEQRGLLQPWTDRE